MYAALRPSYGTRKPKFDKFLFSHSLCQTAQRYAAYIVLAAGRSSISVSPLGLIPHIKFSALDYSLVFLLEI
jgi:hypothetical protein